METLDLAFNYFGTEESVEVAIMLPRITTLVLYGNPVLGPTGEDAMFIYIEDLVDRAIDYRSQKNTTLPDIDVRHHRIYPFIYIHIHIHITCASVD